MGSSAPAALDRRGSVRATGHRPLFRFHGRLARAATLWLAVLGAIFLVAAMAALIGSAGWGYDFEAYYLAALRLARGDTIYQLHTLAEPFRPGPYGLYLYAPPLAVALLPLTTLSLASATIVWVALRIVLLALACWLMPVRPMVRLATFATASFSSAVLTDLHLGNVSVIVAFLSVVIWRWLDRPAGSAALAVALSVRPTMGLVLVWMLLRRQWRAVAGTIVFGVALIALTLPFVGVQGYLDYIQVLRNLTDVTGVQNNLDLGSTVLRLGASPIVATAALFAGYAVGIGAMLVGLRRDREVGYVVTLGATLLLAPLLWDHYLASLIIPAAFLADRGRGWALVLPLMAWLPQPLLPLVVVASTILPLVAHPTMASHRDVPVEGERRPDRAQVEETTNGAGTVPVTPG